MASSLLAGVSCDIDVANHLSPTFPQKMAAPNEFIVEIGIEVLLMNGKYGQGTRGV